MPVETSSNDRYRQFSFDAARRIARSWIKEVAEITERVDRILADRTIPNGERLLMIQREQQKMVRVVGEAFANKDDDKIRVPMRGGGSWVVELPDRSDNLLRIYPQNEMETNHA